MTQSQSKRVTVPVVVVVEADEHGRGEVVAADFRWAQDRHARLVEETAQAFLRTTDQIHGLQRELVELKEVRARLLAELSDMTDPATGEKPTKSQLSSMLGVSRQRVEQILRQRKQL